MVYNGLLPSHFFTPVKSIHTYNSRSAANQSYYIPSARTNYGLYYVILDLMAQNYGIQLEKTLSSLV